MSKVTRQEDLFIEIIQNLKSLHPKSIDAYLSGDEREVSKFPDILINAIIVIKQEIPAEGAKIDGKSFLVNIR
jgi:hypothetical protein